MNVVRYEPWHLLQRFHDEVNQALRGNEQDTSSVATSQWRPAVDIREEKDRFVLSADLPGVEPKDIEITMDKGVLTIRGERTWQSEEEKEGYKRVERVRGTFHRRFNLPDTANPEAITARGNNGVLEISIPKQQQVQPRRIEVGA
ncbi:MAG: Hsp20/alpha crystallin family protein [Candidatus Competibacteraceae bacterium]|nr:Hsp20/alpha crystallin family protein [Candidatus Competibacteraceae bacterium]